MSVIEDYQAIRPQKAGRIYDLVKEAGVDVRFWEVSKITGLPIDPYENTYQNAKWTFGGGAEPLVACVWWSEISVHAGGLLREGNAKQDMERMANQLAQNKGVDASASRRLRNKITKARAFDQLMSEAYRRRKPVRVVLLEGKRAEDDESEASKASHRLLDAALWFVHEYDPFTGKFQLVRGVPPPETAAADPFDNAEDPGEDPALQELLNSSSLSDTERAAIIKARVGQGYFRDALIRRWKGCAVTQCKEPILLIASHIKPWSLCTTRAERLSPDNGILLTPNLDKAFDRGLISFDDALKIVLHPKLDQHTQNTLGIDPRLQLRTRSYIGMQPFLKWHRQNFGFEPKDNVFLDVANDAER